MTPLVSILMFCRNGAPGIRRSIESIVNQTYENIQIVVQDGASTDGTLEILQSFGDRIDLISEPDSGHNEAFWKALQRCNGEIIGSCLADEELLPGAVQTAVDLFQADPDLGAVTGDGYFTDTNGSITGLFKSGEFDLFAYVCRTYCPLFPASFFSRRALRAVGLYDDDDWVIECIEAEIWCRLGTDFRIKYWPKPLSKYSIHDKQLSNTAANIRSDIEARSQLIDRIFSQNGFFKGNETLRRFALASQIRTVLDHIGYRYPTGGDDKVQGLRGELESMLKLIPKGPTESERSVLNGDIVYRPLRNWALSCYYRLSNAVPRPLLNVLPVGLKRCAHLCLAYGARTILLGVSRLIHWNRTAFPLKERSYGYHVTAKLYADRGQIEEAWRLWKKTRPIKDRDIDSEACQALLKSPHASPGRIRESQRRWAAVHTAGRPAKVIDCLPKYDGKRRIRLAYHCATWSADYIKYQVLPLLKRHNRGRFEVYALSRLGPAGLNVPGADYSYPMQGSSDEAFAEAVRNMGVDLLIELTGFSSGHVYAALALRCAPVQVSYINHLATSGVQNVDFIIADEVSAPANLDQFFTERIYRLPGCLFCFSYEESEMPEPAREPPVVKNGFITFGCFGSGSKINDHLVRLWAQVLMAVPNSRLFLRNHQLSSHDNRRFMRRRFESHGIEPERLVPAQGADRRTIVESYDEVDISLDTFPHCGGNTLAESLWQGVPAVTLIGDQIVSRYGASILLHSGCGDLVATDGQEYVSIAKSLSLDINRLVKLRRNLRVMCADNGFADAASFAKRIEGAYEEMLESQVGSYERNGHQGSVTK